MKSDNIVSATLTAADRAAIMTAIETLRQTMPFLIDLDSEARRTLPKMGDKSRAFVEKTFQAVKANPGLLPASFSVAEYERDLELWQALAPIAAQLAQLNELVNDTLLEVGSELYTASLSGYGYLKIAGAGAGLDDLKASLSNRFRKPLAAAALPPAPQPA